MASLPVLALAVAAPATFRCSPGTIAHSNRSSLPTACGGVQGDECGYACDPGYLAIGRHALGRLTRGRGKVYSMAEAASRVLVTLQSLTNRTAGFRVPRNDFGWLPTFFDSDSGRCLWGDGLRGGEGLPGVGCEFSTDSTAFNTVGVLFAKTFFEREDPGSAITQQISALQGGSPHGRIQTHLLELLATGEAMLPVSGTDFYVLWRKSMLDPSWQSVPTGTPWPGKDPGYGITLVDFAAEMFGLSTLWLGADFFRNNTNHWPPSVMAGECWLMMPRGKVVRCV
eukprot:gene32370-21533_t